MVQSYLKDPETKVAIEEVIDEYLEDYDVHPEGLARAIIDKLLKELGRLE